MEIQRESIFVSSLRGFFRSLFALLGIFAAIAIAAFAFFIFSSPYQDEEKTSLQILPDLEWKRDLVSLSAPVVLQINIHGIIGDPERLDTESIESILLDSHKGLLSNNRVKAVLLHFNTPGGTVVDSNNIYRLLLKYKEKFKVPIFGYIDGLCASGGMYIASAADRLFCSPTGIVGSVGVISGPFFNFYDVLTSIGIHSKTITAGLDKDMMSPFRPWKPDEDQSLKTLMNFFYQQFVTVVTTARPRLDKTKLIQEYGAHVFDGPTAQTLGYVDEANSSYDETLLALMKEANINPENPYQVVELKPEHNILSNLMRGESPIFNGKIEHQLQIGSEKAFAIKDPIAYLYQP